MFEPILVKVDNAGPLTGDGNNTFLLTADAAGGRACLIDAGVGSATHVAAVAGRLRDREATLTDILVTHNHADHIAGARALQAAFSAARFSKFRRPEDDEMGIAWRHIGDGATLSVGGTTLQAVHTPGHAPDHLVFWHEPSGTAFTGDLISVTGSVLIAWGRGGDLTAYLSSVERLRALAPSRLLPAHGPPIADPAAALRATIAHRLQRHEQVLAAVRAGRQTVPAIAESIYDGLEPALLAAARENVRAHLEKLTHDGLAMNDAGRWRPV